mgnify:CR=1 FL=1
MQSAPAQHHRIKAVSVHHPVIDDHAEDVCIFDLSELDLKRCLLSLLNLFGVECWGKFVYNFLIFLDIFEADRVVLCRRKRHTGVCVFDVVCVDHTACEVGIVGEQGGETFTKRIGGGGVAIDPRSTDIHPHGLFVEEAECPSMLCFRKGRGLDDVGL